MLNCSPSLATACLPGAGLREGGLVGGRCLGRLAEVPVVVGDLAKNGFLPGDDTSLRGDGPAETFDVGHDRADGSP